MIVEQLKMEVGAFERATGWSIKPEGACKGDVCVPLAGAVVRDTIDLRAAGERLEMPIVADEERGVWAIGPATVTGRALASAEAPPLELPDADGNPFKLSSLLGGKVLLVAWASW